MGVLASIILTIILVTQVLLVIYVGSIAESLRILLEVEPEPEEAKVTDPFVRPRPVHSSTNHIIVPKTPTEIRNQNFKKIKEGVEYGDIKGAE